MHIYTTSIRILAKGYLPISLVTPSRLREILNNVETAIWKTNPDYNLVIETLHLYYDMQLVTFGIDKDKKPHNTIPSIHTTIHTAATDTVSIRNSTSPNYRPGTCRHTLTHNYKLKSPTLL